MLLQKCLVRKRSLPPGKSKDAAILKFFYSGFLIEKVKSGVVA
jgi:hypothetical protein